MKYRRERRRRRGVKRRSEEARRQGETQPSFFCVLFKHSCSKELKIHM
jgi:hypothetical protein